MLDRVRESLFQALSGWLADANVLDLFAGSGSLGFEALSRGASTLRLVDGDAGVVEVLHRNAVELGVRDQATILCGDALDPGTWGTTKSDVVFFDPPYPLLKDMATRAHLFATIQRLVDEQLAPEGVVMFHAPKGAVREDEFGDEVELGRRTYGTNALWFIQAFEPEDAGDA